MRTAFNINVADLTSPDMTEIIRFIWHTDEHTVLVTTRGDKQRTRFTRDNARKCWRRFREAGFLPTDDNPFASDGGFLLTEEAKFEIELEAEMEGGAY